MTKQSQNELMSIYSPEYLEEALKHCRNNKQEIQQSGKCICINCKKVLNASDITEWGEEKNFLVNAVCPDCKHVSVIGSESNLPIDDENFLDAIHSLYKSKSDDDELNPFDKFRSHHRGY